MSQDVIYGIHAAKQFLSHGANRVTHLYLQEGSKAERLQNELNLGAYKHFRPRIVDKRYLDELSASGNHQGIVLQIEVQQQLTEKQLKPFMENLMQTKVNPLILVLDNISDPHNLGACLRSAAAANVDAVILPKDKSAPVNATVRKVAAGATEQVDIFVVTNLARSLDLLKDAGCWLIGTAIDEQAQNYYDCDLTGALVLVMGSEGDGMRRLTREKCDFLAYLPMSERMQSLNVSVATGICLFEAVRQRSKS